jgi:alkanesulfonate monooxygenase SsuD/methylene tetrahydromethanopterin reductase-like flavin-dependent oxidoreductase (luciferase family)
MAELASDSERAGWDGLLIEDYIVYQGQSGTATFDPWVTMAAMAMSTSRIMLGTTVTPVPRRRPWKLASEAVTLDHLSGAARRSGAHRVRRSRRPAAAELADVSVQGARRPDGRAPRYAIPAFHYS